MVNSRKPKSTTPSKKGLQHHSVGHRTTGYRQIIEVHLLFPHLLAVGVAHRLATLLEERLPQELSRCRRNCLRTWSPQRTTQPCIRKSTTRESRSERKPVSRPARNFESEPNASLVARLAFWNVGAVPPSAAERLKERGRIEVTVSLGLRESDHGLLVHLLAVQEHQIIRVARVDLL